MLREAEHVSRFPCPISGCDRILASERMRTTHLATIHAQPTNQTYVCGRHGCAVTFPTVAERDGHEMIAHRTKSDPSTDHVCECGREFASAQGLNLHRVRAHAYRKQKDVVVASALAASAPAPPPPPAAPKPKSPAPKAFEGLLGIRRVELTTDELTELLEALDIGALNVADADADQIRRVAARLQLAAKLKEAAG